MTHKIDFKTKKGYQTGFLSGITWGVDTSLIALALSLSAFTSDPGMLYYGTFVCCLIHIFFETIFMGTVITRDRLWGEVKNSARGMKGFVCVLGGLLGGPVAMTCYLLAIELTGADLTTTVTATYPLIGAILAIILLKERVTSQMWLGILLCVFGIFYSGVFVDFKNDTVAGMGLLLAMITSLGWGFEGVACRYVVNTCNVPPKVALFIREIACLIVYAAIAPLFLGSFSSVGNAIGQLLNYWPAFLLVAVAASFGAYSMLLWYRCIYKVGASKGLCINVTYCIWTIIFTAILFQNMPSINIVTGAIITIAGIALALWPRKVMSLDLKK